MSDYGWTGMGGLGLGGSTTANTQKSGTGSGGTASGQASYEQWRNEQLQLLEQNFAQREAARRAAYDAVAGAHQSAYNQSAAVLGAEADKALQQSYVAKRLGERNLNQTLSASGRSGGAAETTRLALENNYANNGGEVESARVSGLARLRAELDSALAKARSAYETDRIGDLADRYKDESAVLQTYQKQMSAARASVAKTQAAALAAAQTTPVSVQTAAAAASRPTSNQTWKNDLDEDYYTTGVSAYPGMIPNIVPPSSFRP